MTGSSPIPDPSFLSLLLWVCSNTISRTTRGGGRQRALAFQDQFVQQLNSNFQGFVEVNHIIGGTHMSSWK